MLGLLARTRCCSEHALAALCSTMLGCRSNTQLRELECVHGAACEVGCGWSAGESCMGTKRSPISTSTASQRYGLPQQQVLGLASAFQSRGLQISPWTGSQRARSNEHRVTDVRVLPLEDASPKHGVPTAVYWRSRTMCCSEHALLWCRSTWLLQRHTATRAWAHARRRSRAGLRLERQWKLLVSRCRVEPKCIGGEHCSGR